jgi:hypothetical protein
MLLEMTTNRPDCRPQALSVRHRGTSRTFVGFYPKFDVLRARMKDPEATKDPVSQVFLHEDEILIDPKPVGSATEPRPAPPRMNPLERLWVVPQSAAQQMPRPVSRCFAAGDTNVGFRPNSVSGDPASDQIARSQRASAKCRSIDSCILHAPGP